MSAASTNVTTSGPRAASVAAIPGIDDEADGVRVPTCDRNGDADAACIERGHLDADHLLGVERDRCGRRTEQHGACVRACERTFFAAGFKLLAEVVAVPAYCTLTM